MTKYINWFTITIEGLSFFFAFLYDANSWDFSSNGTRGQFVTSLESERNIKGVQANW